MNLKKYIDEDGNCVLPGEITEIEEEAFKNCTSLISISIPNTVTAIKNFAFMGCSSLISVSIPDSVKTIGVKAFAFCNCLTDVSISNSVKAIGWGTFMSCTSMTSIYIPNSVTEIGYEAFRDCTALAAVSMSRYTSKIGASAFNGCRSLCSIAIPNCVVKIGESAFEECSSLTDISIPNSVTKIKEGTFKNCSSLTDIYIPNSVEQIYGDYLYESVGAFEGCTSLTTVSIPDSVVKIGNSTFRGCSSLSRFYCPERLIEMVKCIGVPEKSIIKQVYSDENKSIYKDGMCVFYGDIVKINIKDVSKRNDITRVKMLDGVSKIGDNAFKNCKNLTDVIIPNSVSSVGKDAFKGCVDLKSIKCSRWLVNECFDENNKRIVKIGDAVVPEAAVICVKINPGKNDCFIDAGNETEKEFYDWVLGSLCASGINSIAHTQTAATPRFDSNEASYAYIYAPEYIPTPNVNKNAYGIITSYIDDDKNANKTDCEFISFRELENQNTPLITTANTNEDKTSGEKKEPQMD